MNHCPHCSQSVPFRTVAFAPFPVWITCPHCHTKLVGDRFIKLQGFLIIPTLVMALVIPIVLTRLPFLHQMALAVAASLLVALPNVIATLKWGRYLPRTPKKDTVPLPQPH